MTHDETRDELARLKGWKSRPYAGILKLWYHPDGRERMDEHPMPPTLDGANAAVPDGWEWARYPSLFRSWVAFRPGRPYVEVPDTGDPVHDLYALALACVRAEEDER